MKMWTGAGEHLLRPLSNPFTVQISAFQDHDPKGFGLMQRSRSLEAYNDLEARYERRPSMWVEPVGRWGAGSVQLLEIPTDDETADNIAAFWRPKAARSEERRVGKGCVSKCKSRWSPSH